MAIERWRPRWGITPWRPFRDLEEWERRFDDLLGRPLRRLPVDERGWMPAVDVFEKDDKFVVKAELPGMKENDIDVSVVGDTLCIRGEKKTETEVKDEDEEKRKLRPKLRMKTTTDVSEAMVAFIARSLFHLTSMLTISKPASMTGFSRSLSPNRSKQNQRKLRYQPRRRSRNRRRKLLNQQKRPSRQPNKA